MAIDSRPVSKNRYLSELYGGLGEGGAAGAPSQLLLPLKAFLLFGTSSSTLWLQRKATGLDIKSTATAGNTTATAHAATCQGCDVI